MGPLAALLTSICWAFSSIFFSAAGKSASSVIINRIRLLLTSLLLLITHFVIQGSILPINSDWGHWFWLGISGVVGLALGDALLFQAYVMIGPRLTTLVMASVPVFSTIMAWVLLNQRLTIIEISGIILTVGGISWVILENNSNGHDHNDRRHQVYGILFACGAAVCQAMGLVLSGRGLAGGFPPLSAVIIRILVAMIVVWLEAIIRGQIGATVNMAKNPYVLKYVTMGSIVGPFIGVWLSMIAVQQIRVGIASTLMALTPIFVLPLSRLFFKENISFRAVFGTLAALVGVAIIYILPG
jgi:drug/metabolite transporter (DMT)-like permease